MSEQWIPPDQCPMRGSPFVHVMGAIAEYACGYWLDRHGIAFKRPRGCIQFQIEDLRRALAWMICEDTKGCPHPCSTDAPFCEGVKEKMESRIAAARKDRVG